MTGPLNNDYDDLDSPDFGTMIYKPGMVTSRPARRFKISTGWIIFVLCWLPGIAYILYEVMK
jgi:hypothetical protein